MLARSLARNSVLKDHQPPSTFKRDKRVMNNNGDYVQ